MIFEIRNGWVFKRNKKIELTPRENRLLQVLANNQLNSLYDIYRYVYPNEVFDYSIDPYTPVRIHKSRLQRKLNLKIRTVNNRGYKLLDTILINY